MNKRKDSLALFEVISKAKQRVPEPVKVPAREARPGPGAAPAPAAGVPAPAPVVLPVAGAPGQLVAQAGAPAAAPRAPEPAPRARPATMPARPPRTSPFGERAIGTAGGRLRVSLSSSAASALGAGFVVLLTLAFLAGRASVGGFSPRPKEGEQAPGQSALKPGTGPTAPAGKPARQEGKFYLIIETMKGATEQDKVEAFRIADFCTRMGEPADVQQYRTQYIVWSLTPFAAPSGLANDKYAESVEKLGQKYFQQHRTYMFKQRDRSGQMSPRFLVYKPPTAK